MNMIKSFLLFLGALLIFLLSACATTALNENSGGSTAYQLKTTTQETTIWGGNVPGKSVPIILVHGFMGFDSDSDFSFPYWGGTVDLEKQLRSSGFRVYTAEIGPFSSNWDRACELYAYIKGGVVDYGLAHSKKYGHSRYGEYYPGVFPQWGTYSEETGRVRKVHLIGHSMGGQTVRVLVDLLARGNAAERRAAERAGREASPVSPLFSGGRSWVSSVTTIATPHDGTTLTERYNNLDGLHKFFARLIARSSLKKDDPLLELHLEHWAVMKKPTESFERFIMRVISQNLWRETEDFSYYDLSLPGAKRLNQHTSTLSEVYYFSWATSRTEADDETGHHVPMRGMSLLLHPFARYMGSLANLPGTEASDEGREGISEEWWENDGLVNTCSMDGPSLGRDEKIIHYSEKDGVPTPGKWYFMGTFKPLDHFQVSLVLPISGDPPPGYSSLSDFYERWCTFITALPEVD